MQKHAKAFVVLALLLVCSPATSLARIGIVVNKDLYPHIAGAVQQYIEDIQKIEEKSVWLDYTSFGYDETWTKPEEMQAMLLLREELRWRYENRGLEGAVLIGKLPSACDAAAGNLVAYGTSTAQDGPVE